MKRLQENKESNFQTEVSNLDFTLQNSGLLLPSDKNVMQHDELISINMRNHCYTERMTYFNSFKKSNNSQYIDEEFLPSIQSVFPNYEKQTQDLAMDYTTHTNQIIPN